MDEPKAPPSVYTDKQLRAMEHKYSRLKPVEPGDLCCNCGGDCWDSEGLTRGIFHAYRINGHPICVRDKCYAVQMQEYGGTRSGCRCGLRGMRKNSE
jgi:hypothetical protein